MDRPSRAPDAAPETARQAGRRTAPASPEESLAVRAAWLHYAGGLTQAEVARRLGLNSVKTHRLIAKAVAEGAVKVAIDGDIVECIDLEMRLSARYGLDYCEVAPDLGEDGLPLRTLGIAGASYLKREIELGETPVIGLGHGRTLAAVVQNLQRVDAGATRFVSLLGGVTRNYAANPHDVMVRIAEKTAAQAYVMPVPIFANTAEDREVLLSQRGVRDVYEMSCRAGLKIVGVGTVDPDAQLVASGMIEPAEISEIAAVGGVGEILGHFFGADGRLVETPLTARTIAATPRGPEGSRIVAIAGGPGKVAAIAAVLRSGRLKGLVTDEATANALAAL